MLSSKKKLQLAAAFATLLMVAGSVACNGFFVDATLTSIAIVPSAPTLQTVGQTVQLVATGTYNDGSTQNLTGSSTWTSSDTAVVKVNSSGLATAVTSVTNTATITATNTSKSGAISGTATVSIGASTGAITVTCDEGTSISLSGNGGAGSAVTFTASDQNGNDVTSQASWTSSNSSIISIASNSAGSGTLGGTTGTVTITATVSGASGSVPVTVTQ